MSGRLVRLEREGVARVGDAREDVAVLEFGVVEHLLVVVLDEVPGVAVGDVATAGDTLALAAGVGQVPALVLAGLEDRLVVGDLDGLAFLRELDLVGLDLVIGDRTRIEATVLLGVGRFALAEFTEVTGL